MESKKKETNKIGISYSPILKCTNHIICDVFDKKYPNGIVVNAEQLSKLCALYTSIALSNLDEKITLEDKLEIVDEILEEIFNGGVFIKA